MQKEPEVMAFIGKRGCGKSHHSMKLMQKYIQEKTDEGVPAPRCLIMDVNMEYSDIPAIELSDLNSFSGIKRIICVTSKGVNISLSEYEAGVIEVLRNYRNGFLLIEDFYMYNSDSRFSQEFEAAVCTNRSKRLTICIHYRAIEKVTPKIWQNLNLLCLYKSISSFKRLRHSPQFEILKIAENMTNHAWPEHDERFFVWVDLGNEKITGDFSKELFESAVSIYIDANKKRLLKLYENKFDKNGNKLFTDEKAIEAEQERIVMTYL